MEDMLAKNGATEARALLNFSSEWPTRISIGAKPTVRVLRNEDNLPDSLKRRATICGS